MNIKQILEIILFQINLMAKLVGNHYNVLLIVSSFFIDY